MTRWVVVTSVAGLPSLNAPKCIDAYLVWDEITGYARHGFDPSAAWPDGVHLPVLMELPADPPDGKPAASALDAFIARWRGAGVSARDRRALRTSLAASVQHAAASSIHTAFARRGLVACLHDAVTAGHLRRFTLGAPCDLDVVRRRTRTLPASTPEHEADTLGVIGGKLHTLGVIDDGCCFAHESFRFSDSTPGGDALPTRSRILALWDQETGADIAGSRRWRRCRHADATSAYAYGSELLQQDIEALLREHPRLGERHERTAYAAIGRPRWGAPQHTHGARVMHLLAGPDRPHTAGVGAGQLPIVFVQLPQRTVSDTSGDSLGVHVVDGARYIVARTRDHAISPKAWSTSINISLGSIAGPHDGTSMAEQALSDLVTHGQGRVDVVVAAGNTADRRRIHGQRQVRKGSDGEFLVRVPPGCERDSFVEFWLPTCDADEEFTAAQVGAMAPERFAITVTPPGGNGCEPFRVGSAAHMEDPDGRVIAGVVFARRVAQGLRGTMVLLAIGPTAHRRGRRRGLAPAGIWTVSVSSDALEAAEVHAWVERDDIIVGDRRPQQTRLEHGPGERPGSSYITDSHTLASLSNAPGVHVVGGCVESSAEMARYSGIGPLRGELALTKPDWFAPSDRSPTLRGVVVPGFFSGTRSTIGGTSAAAPRVARLLAERRLPKTRNPNDIRHRDVQARLQLRPARGDGRALPDRARIEPWLGDRLQRRQARHRG